MLNLVIMSNPIKFTLSWLKYQFIVKYMGDSLYNHYSSFPIITVNCSVYSYFFPFHFEFFLIAIISSYIIIILFVDFFYVQKSFTTYVVC